MIPIPKPTFATNPTFVAGSDAWAGDPTRVDPSAARRAEGYEPDSLPAQWLNFELGTHGDWIEYARRRRLASVLGHWTARTSVAGTSVRGVASREGTIAGVGIVPTLPVDHFLAVSVQAGVDKIQGSSDGSIWTDSSGGLTENNVFDLRYLAASNRWIAACGDGGGGFSGGAIYSRVAGNLGTAWSLVQGPVGGHYTSLACSSTRAIALGLLSRVATSTDGVTWTNLTAFSTLLVPSDEAPDIEFGGGIFVAVCRDTILTSTDGTTWTTRLLIAAVGPGSVPSRVTYDLTRGRFFVSSSANGTSKVYHFLASDPATISSFSLAQSANDLSACNGVLALVSGNHIRYTDDLGISIAYAYAGPTAITGARICASPVLSCFLVAGDDGAGATFLTQSQRGV